MKQVNIEQIKKILFEEGYHVLLFSDAQINKMSGLTRHTSRINNQVKGLVMPDRNEIAINKNLNLKEKVLTLIHEIIHICNPKLSENQTERLTYSIYRHLNLQNLGLMEFAVSHNS